MNLDKLIVKSGIIIAAIGFVALIIFSNGIEIENYKEVDKSKEDRLLIFKGKISWYNIKKKVAFFKLDNYKDINFIIFYPKYYQKKLLKSKSYVEVKGILKFNKNKKQIFVKEIKKQKTKFER